MRFGYIIIVCWTFFYRAEGRSALLPEFNFKKVSRTNFGSSPVSFSGMKLLNRAVERPKEKTSQSRIELPNAIKINPFKNFKQVTQRPRIQDQVIPTKQTVRTKTSPVVQSTWVQLPPKIGGNSKLPIHDDRTLTLQDRTFKDRSPTKNIKFTKLLHVPRSTEKSSKWHMPPQRTTKKVKGKELETTLVGQKVPKHGKSQIMPTKSVPIQNKVTENPLSNSEVTVVVKSEGTPKPVEELPYCSWIEPSNCPDFSRVQPSCIETLSVSSLRGECKMCPFNWCKGPNDMAGSGKLQDQSPLDVVLGPSNYRLAVNVPGNGQKQGVSNLGNNPPPTTTTEIPFWNFQTFGP